MKNRDKVIPKVNGIRRAQLPSRALDSRARSHPRHLVDATMVETKFWDERDSGIVDGCTFVVQWGDLWGVAIPLYLALVVAGTVAAFKLFNAGHRPWALLVSGVVIALALSLIGGPHCHAESAALETTYWSNWVLLAFCILCGGFLHAFRDSALRPGGWASALIYRKVASPRTSDFFRKDLVFLGPLNEILSMTWGECVVWTAVVAWLVVAAVDKYINLTADPPTMNSGLETALGNKTRALGKAFAQISVRCVFLSVISPTRNVVLYQMFGIPFERGIKAHKQAGRLMVVAGWLHVICMLAGGTERTGVKWTNTVDMNSPNPIFGPFALAAWTAMLLLSLPYFRRHKFEHFYVIHLNLWFVGNVMTVLHNRKNAVVWIVAGVLTLWLDFAVRWYAKLARKSTLVNFDVVAENLVKMVVKRDGAWPGGAFDFHPGSYIWLSVDVPAEKRAAYMREVDVKPVIPVPIPSFVWFHPITVSSFDPASGELTLFIKRMGEGEEQWSGQIIATLKAVRDGKDLSKEDVRVHIGGPNGSLQVNPDWMDHCVLVSGGIGVTPMAAILEDRVRKARRGGFVDPERKNKTTFVWTTRAAEEIVAFKYLFDAVAALEPKARALFDVRVFYTGASAPDAESSALDPSVVSVSPGRPDVAAILAGAATEGEKTAAYVCGPEALSDAVEAAATAAGCLVHRETFEF